MGRLLTEANKIRSGSATPRVRKTLQGILFASAVLMLGFGLLRGEAAVVLRKAIHVCLECIGIG